MKPDLPILTAHPQLAWGSDVAAEMLRRLGLEYVCINPGSSFRGLHDSLVNYLGNERPSILLALHEETVVSIAHGYAKAAGRPMAAVLHSNVGLMHGMMAIFNAWCDRVPILLLGATGAVDTAVRRSWIDWMHTFRDQGVLLRQFIKWDDQPASPAAIIDAIARAYMMACTAPCGPAYVILDRRLQEDRLAAQVVFPNLKQLQAPSRLVPSNDYIAAATRALYEAHRPVMLLGRMSRSHQDWQDRVRLAELLGARVVTDLRTGATFPTDHPLHGAPADLFLTPGNLDILAAADVVLSLDWIDIADAMILVRERGNRPKVIHVSVDHQIHNGWSGDHQRLVPADIRIPVEPDAILKPLIGVLEELGRVPRSFPPIERSPQLGGEHGRPTLADIGAALRSGER